MDTNEIKSAMQRIMRGERATVVVPAVDFQRAKDIFDSLSPALRSRLTLVRGANPGEVR